MLINDKGSVFACGWSADGQTGVGHYNNTERLTKCIGDIDGEKIVKLSCSADCVLALNGSCFSLCFFKYEITFIFFYSLDKGQLFGWGNSEYGQLKLATTETQLHTPRHISLPPALGKFTDIATTGTACLVLNGRIYFYIFSKAIICVTVDVLILLFRKGQGICLGLRHPRQRSRCRAEC